MADAVVKVKIVVVVIAEKAFAGEKKLKKGGGKICHNSDEPGVAEAFRLIKEGKAKVYVVEKVSDQILKRMIAKAIEFGNEVQEGLTLKQLRTLLK